MQHCFLPERHLSRLGHLPVNGKQTQTIAAKTCKNKISFDLSDRRNSAGGTGDWTTMFAEYAKVSPPGCVTTTRGTPEVGGAATGVLATAKGKFCKPKCK